MPKPCGPRAIVGDPAERWNPGHSILNVTGFDHRRRLMKDGLIKPRPSAPGLIDHVRGDSVTHEIWRPTFTAIRRRLETRSSMRRSVHHNYGRRVRFLARWYLELHIHLTNRDLVGSERLVRRIRRRERCIVRHLRNTTDEEAALILDHERLRQEFLRLADLLRRNCRHSQKQQKRRKQTPTDKPHGILLFVVECGRTISDAGSGTQEAPVVLLVFRCRYLSSRYAASISLVGSP